MPKVTFVGAGSAVFARQLMTDILAVEGLDSGVFALVDIDGTRLELARQIGERLVGLSGKRWTVQASTERADVLKGSDYVINSIEVAGLQNVRHDYDIPLKYGIDQCIGDTIGPGGIFKALRTGPAWLDIVADVEREAPRAVVLNYTNPMSILTLAAARASGLTVIGLCHSVQGTSRLLAEYLDVPYDQLDWRCAGINHNAWFTTLEHRGKDLYPLLRERAAQPEIYERDPVRFEVMLHLGAFVTESSGHFSEYVPYFRKRPDLLKKYIRPGYLGQSGFYADNWPDWRSANDERIHSMLRGETDIPIERSHEYASYIIEAMEHGRPTSIHGNILNNGAVENLATDGCVEVECSVGPDGVRPVRFGKLPEQLAALNRSHMAVHELVVQALLERNRRKAKYALMLDPLTAAVCSLEEVDRLFEEMWGAERASLAAFD
ncbi:MAG TPA: alpha-galactosidase [Candidatus Dormibacteraeota bacterium]|nr:alpha-galactosidase [Candidatus Dormibacteraeota bacterium]